MVRSRYALPIMAVVAQWLEHQVMALGVVGSILINRPICLLSLMDKTPDYGSGESKFDSWRGRQYGAVDKCLSHCSFTAGIAGWNPVSVTIIRI